MHICGFNTVRATQQHSCTCKYVPRDSRSSFKKNWLYYKAYSWRFTNFNPSVCTGTLEIKFNLLSYILQQAKCKLNVHCGKNKKWKRIKLIGIVVQWTFFLMKRGNGILSSTSKNYRYTSVRDWEKYQLRQLLFKY